MSKNILNKCREYICRRYIYPGFLKYFESILSKIFKIKEGTIFLKACFNIFSGGYKKF